MNLPRIHQILTRVISEMAGHELETINRLEEGDVIRFPGHGIPADELKELEGLLKKKPNAETTQPSKPEKKAPEGPLPRQATSEKPKTVKKAQKPGRLTSLNKGQTVMIHQGGKRKDWYVERTTAGTYAAVAGAKMQRSKTLEGALRWLWKQSQGGMQRQITKAFDLDAIKAGNTPPEEKTAPAPPKSTSSLPKPKMSFSQAQALKQEQKLETPTARLTWNDHTWTLEELPQKGKKRLRVAKLPNPLQNFRHNQDYMQFWLPINVIMYAGLSKTDTYDKIKSKLEKSYDDTKKSMKERLGKLPILGPTDWSEKSIQAAKIKPTGTEPIKVKGKDFTMTSTWTEFSARDNYSYGNSGWTKSKTPGGARKLYKILRNSPHIFDKMTNTEMWRWLRDRRIGFTSF